MQQVALGEVVRIDRTPATDADCRSLPYVGLEHIEKDIGRFASDYDGSVADMLATQFRFTSEHVLYGKLRPYLNKVALPNFDGVCTTEILPLLPKSAKLDRTYLWAMLLSPKFVEWASNNVSGANLPRLAPSLLAAYPIPLPPLAEQQRIAGLLRRADRLRRLRRYALAVSAGYLQAVFVEMFGDPVRNPMGWERKYLRSVAVKFSDGPFGSNLKSEHYVADGIRVIRLQNIGVGRFIDQDKAFISEEHFGQLNRYRCLPGDIVIGTLGDPNLRSCILPPSIPVALNKADCIQMRVNSSKVVAEYICWLLNHPKTLELATGMIHGQTRSRISMGQLATLEVPIPTLNIQKRFATVVQRFERINCQQEEALRQAEHLFQALLRRAFAEGVEHGSGE
ncbi:MAG: restriction endonuclease subunit S [Caldilineaceae bacterium]|nr:restriction endonuclease subunit S [Caldilineaceae bacterium]